MQKAVLIIDDDAELRDGLRLGLSRAGFIAAAADSAESARPVLERVAFDAIILDRMMPGVDGLSFLREIREKGIEAPVVMLTAMDGPENTIAGLEVGADDYLAKPFSMRELVLRLGNLAQRTAPAAADGSKMPDGLSFSDGEFWAGGRPMVLPEAAKAALVEMLGGGVARIPAMTAKRLREKLRLAKIAGIDIIPVRGRGYKIAAREE